MIAIIDYNMGNLWSVFNAFRKIGAAAELTCQPADLAKATGIVLPGVGAFDQAMDNLDELGMSPEIKKRAAAGVPFLGFCLGLQVLFSKSEEGRDRPGLDIIKGTIKRLPPGDKVPHMGWNQVNWARQDPLLTGIADAPHMYFAHSYYVVPDDDQVVLGKTNYVGEFASAVAKDKIYATQFHPEKSGETGLALLRNFVEIAK